MKKLEGFWRGFVPRGVGGTLKQRACTLWESLRGDKEFLRKRLAFAQQIV